MFPLFYNPTFLILVPAMILAFYAQGKVKNVFEKYTHQSNMAGMTGREVAERLLHVNGLDDVRVEIAPEGTGDHYNPAEKVVRLSPVVYNSASLTGLGVAAHEIGHAVQHGEGYRPLNLRKALIPVTNFGSIMAFPLLLLGIFLSLPTLIKFGILAFLAVVVFQVITLPVEYNASRRAITMLETNGLIKPFELKAIDSVLNAAAFTYVAATLMAVSNLARLLILSGMGRNRD